MIQDTLAGSIADQTKRALWEVKNVIDCIPSAYWNKPYCKIPLWKHVYHMLHSLDVWFINPKDNTFKEPSIHEKDLNNLNVPAEKELSRSELNHYFTQIQAKITDYIQTLDDECLLEMPEGCAYTKFTLIIAQNRHLHTHMGMIMGFIVAETGLWPRVVGLEGVLPEGNYAMYF